MSWNNGTIIHTDDYNAERVSVSVSFVQMICARIRSGGVNFTLATSSGASHPRYVFRQIVGVPAVMLSLANYDNNHAEDEHIRAGNLQPAINELTKLVEPSAYSAKS